MKNLQSKIVILLFAVLAAGLFVNSFSHPGLQALAVNDHENGQIDICHYTQSHFVTNHPNKSGNVDGHDGHDNDIIPPFDYWVHVSGPTWTLNHYDGKNWNTNGQAIWNNGCVAPTATPTPSPTVSPTVSPTASPTVTPTSSPTPTVTPTPTFGAQCDGECEVDQTDDTPTPTVTETPSATPTQDPGVSPTPTTGSSSSSNSSSNTSLVAGASATNPDTSGKSGYANTGTFENTFANAMLSLGVVISGVSTALYGKKRKAVQK